MSGVRGYLIKLLITFFHYMCKVWRAPPESTRVHSTPIDNTYVPSMTMDMKRTWKFMDSMPDSAAAHAMGCFCFQVHFVQIELKTSISMSEFSSIRGQFLNMYFAIEIHCTVLLFSFPFGRISATWKLTELHCNKNNRKKKANWNNPGTRLAWPFIVPFQTSTIEGTIPRICLFAEAIFDYRLIFIAVQKWKEMASQIVFINDIIICVLDWHSDMHAV